VFNLQVNQIQEVSVTGSLTFQVSMDEPYENAVGKVTEALKTEGFGVLTRIDVKATLKEKLDTDFRPYIILGACHPPLAHQALQSNPLIGLIMPCNVTVEETDDGSLVNIVNPEVLLGMEPFVSDNQICEVAEKARYHLERVAEALKKV
jgi:uncharacterized protein (DUF302 family)